LLKRSGPLGVQSERSDQKGIHNRWHIVSVANCGSSCAAQSDFFSVMWLH